MHPRTSIYHKLILYIFFLGIFVIVAVSLYSFITSRNAIMDRTFDQLTSLRVAKKEQVEQFFKDRVKEVELFSHLDVNRSISVRTGKMSGLITFNRPNIGLDSNFEEFFKSGNYYSKIYLLKNAEVECIFFDSSSVSRREIIKNELHMIRPLFEDVKQSKVAKIHDFSMNVSDSSTHMFIVSPLSTSSVTDPAIAIFEIRASAISNIMKNKELTDGLGKSGEVYLVGPDSLMRSESRFYQNSILRQAVLTESVRNAFKLSEGTRLNIDYRNVMTLSSYSRLNIPGLNWIVIAEIDRKEAMRPVYKLANEIVFLSIFITMILFIAAYVISRSIAGPIIELKDATIRVRHGELDPLLHIKSNDELGELTENFNLMTSQLKAQQEELKERENRMFSSFIDGQEDERQRLSRELHDGLGQMIVATKLKMESIMNTGNGINTENMSRLRTMFESLVEEVRGISNNLMPAALQEFGLEMALSQICREISALSRINVIFDSQIARQQLDKRIATYIFRIAQEALNNAVKHSGASEIIMTLIGNEKMISLMVQDNGVGISLETPCDQNGRGLNSMCERVKLLNGLIDISKGEENGTIVSVKIPLT